MCGRAESYGICGFGDLQQLLLGPALSVLGLSQVLLQVVSLLQPTTQSV